MVESDELLRFKALRMYSLALSACLADLTGQAHCNLLFLFTHQVYSPTEGAASATGRADLFLFFLLLFRLRNIVPVRES